MHKKIYDLLSVVPPKVTAVILKMRLKKLQAARPINEIPRINQSNDVLKNPSQAGSLNVRTKDSNCCRGRKRGRPEMFSICKYCSEEFCSRKEFLKHRKKHANEPHTCETCLKTFTRNQAYVMHLKSHRETPRLKCSVAMCEKSFRYKSDLIRHEKTHQVKQENLDE